MPKGNEIRLFSEFYSSDVIVASPLGMVLTFNSNKDEDEDEDNVILESDSDDDDDNDEEGNDGEKNSKKKSKKAAQKSTKKGVNKTKGKDGVPAADFLSSIEVALVVNTDTMAMQNFDHVLRVFELMNRRPLIERGSDYSRVRSWYLSDDPFNAARYRQTILLSNCMIPAMVGLFQRKCQSHAGKLRFRTVSKNGAAASLTVSHRQIFQRVAHMARSLKEADEVYSAVLVTLLQEFSYDWLSTL